MYSHGGGSYGRDPSLQQRVARFLAEGGAPLTLAVMIAAGVGFFFSQNISFVKTLAFATYQPWLRPWTLLTYVVVNDNPISVFFSISWLYSIGTTLERSWGTRAYGIFLAIVTAASAVALWLGADLLGDEFVLPSLWLPVFALTVAFCMLNPDARFFNLIPAQAGIYIAFGLAFFHFWPNMRSGIFGTGGCFAAYAYIRWVRIAMYRPSHVVGWRGRQIEVEPLPSSRRGRLRNPLEAYARWKRKRDFMRLMKQSGIDDEIKPKG